MEIRIRETGQLVSNDEFRAMHSNISFAALDESTLDAFGADVVFEGPQATGGTRYQYSQRDGVEQINGKWYTKYVLGPIFTDNEEATAAEQESTYKAAKDAEQASSVRSTRNQKLAESDWTQVADAPVEQAEWATYRQALRDITSQSGFPWEVQWPVQP